MKEEILSIASDLREGNMTASEAQAQLLRLFSVSQRTFTSTCTEVEDMAVEIDQFINQHALAKPMTYSRKLRQYLATKLNEYVG